MPLRPKKPLDALRIAALTAAGMTMAATPLAIWVAWSQVVLVLVLGTGVAAGVLYCVLYPGSKAADEEQREDPRARTMEDLDDEFLSEMSNMGPFIYHNRLSGDCGFRRQMARLKKLVSRTRPKPGSQLRR